MILGRAARRIGSLIGGSLILAALCAAPGCAKFPADGAAGTSTRVLFTMKVAGKINTNYVYLIAMHPSQDANPTDQGPIPVIGQPWGNGFVAGTVDLFVRWDPLTSPTYIVYRFQDVNLIQYVQVGVPVTYTSINPGDTTIQFSLDINQIAANLAEVPLLKSMQVNFLTMDRVPQGNDSGTKFYDALGNTQDPGQINDYVIIPLDRSGVYNNTRFNNLEPQGDTPDPDLDIVDWSVEVRIQ